MYSIKSVTNSNNAAAAVGNRGVAPLGNASMHSGAGLLQLHHRRRSGEPWAKSESCHIGSSRTTPISFQDF